MFAKLWLLGAHRSSPEPERDNGRRPSTRSRRVSLQVEELESRLAPASFMVTNNSDTGVSGDGSLRGELLAATAGATVNFASTLTGGQTITLGSTLTLSKNVTITAAGVAPVTVTGNNTFTIFVVNTGITATLDTLTITGGLAPTHTLPAGGTSGGLGGGILTQGPLTVSNCTIMDNGVTAGTKTPGEGGGIYVQGISGGSLMLVNSTVTGNTATGGSSGAGIGGDSASAITILNSTISGNSATGTYSGSFITVPAAGGGIASVASIVMTNTIVAGNTATDAADSDLQASITGTNNLIGNGDGDFGGVPTGNLSGTTANPLNPLLAPLGNYGGPTETFALLPGSPAIDAGTSSGAPRPTSAASVGRRVAPWTSGPSSREGLRSPFPAGTIS